MTVKDYYETIKDIDQLAEVVDAEGAVTLDHEDAEQIWALLLDYRIGTISGALDLMNETGKLMVVVKEAGKDG